MYATDTAYSVETVALARGCDVLVHEATFASADADVADASGHSTSAAAARVAREAGAARLVLTHISSRYAPGNPVDLPQLLAEARDIFAETVVAGDMMIIEVPRRDEHS